MIDRNSYYLLYDYYYVKENKYWFEVLLFWGWFSNYYLIIIINEIYSFGNFEV